MLFRVLGSLLIEPNFHIIDNVLLSNQIDTSHFVVKLCILYLIVYFVIRFRITSYRDSQSQYTVRLSKYKQDKNSKETQEVLSPETDQ
jgi:hypothetical protein